MTIIIIIIIVHVQNQKKRTCVCTKCYDIIKEKTCANADAIDIMHLKKENGRRK